MTPEAILSAAQLEEIKEREQAATAGPWAWQINIKGKTVTLQGGRPRLDLSVMQFERWGMNRAAPTFMIPGQRDGLQAWERADHYAATVPGREHHASWFQRIAHPDAAFIAHARTDVPALLAHIEALEARQTTLTEAVENYEAMLKRAATRNPRLPTEMEWRSRQADVIDAARALAALNVEKEA